MTLVDEWITPSPSQEEDAWIDVPERRAAPPGATPVELPGGELGPAFTYPKISRRPQQPEVAPGTVPTDQAGIVTPDAVSGAAPPAPGEELGRLGSAAGSFMQGIAGVGASFPKSAATAEAQRRLQLNTILDQIDAGTYKITGREGPMTGFLIGYEGSSPEDRAILRQDAVLQTDPRQMAPYKAGEAIEQAAKEQFPSHPVYEQEWISGTLPKAGGSAVGFVGTGLIGAGLKLPAAIPMIVAGAASNSSEMFEDALKKGASLEDAFRASNMGAVVGTTEAIPIISLFNRWDKATAGGVRKFILDVLKQGGEELTQETFSALANNLIASGLVAYDPERGIFQGVGEAAGTGFTIGALMQTAAGLLAGRRGRAAPRTQTEVEQDAIKQQLEERKTAGLPGPQPVPTSTPAPAVPPAATEQPPLEEVVKQAVPNAVKAVEDLLQPEAGGAKPPIAPPAPSAPATAPVQPGERDLFADLVRGYEGAETVQPERAPAPAPEPPLARAAPAPTPSLARPAPAPEPSPTRLAPAPEPPLAAVEEPPPYVTEEVPEGAVPAGEPVPADEWVTPEAVAAPPEAAVPPVDSRQMFKPPDPLDLAMSNQLTPESTKEVADQLKRNQEEIENQIFRSKEVADQWRKLQRQSNRAWDNAQDAKAKDLDRQITELETRVGLTPQDEAYLNGEGWPENSDPELWQELSVNLNQVWQGRPEALGIASAELGYLPKTVDWNKLAGTEKRSLISILSALNAEVQAGRDPKVFLRDLANERIRRYGGGPDAIEVTQAQIEQLAGLMSQPIQREGGVSQPAPAAPAPARIAPPVAPAPTTKPKKLKPKLSWTRSLAGWTAPGFLIKKQQPPGALSAREARRQGVVQPKSFTVTVGKGKEARPLGVYYPSLDAAKNAAEVVARGDEAPIAEAIAPRPRKKALAEKRPLSLLESIAANGGISASDPKISDVKSIFGGKKGFIPGYGNIIRDNGLPLDRVLGNAMQDRYIIDPGYDKSDVQLTKAINDLLDAMREENDSKVKRLPRGQELAAPIKEDEAARAFQRERKRIVDAFAQADEPILEKDLTPEALDEAARALAGGYDRNPMDVYDEVVESRAREDLVDAEPAGDRGDREEAGPSGGKAARPRSEKKAFVESEREPRARAPRRAPRQAVSQKAVNFLQEEFVSRLGRKVEPLDSAPLSTILSEIDLSYLPDVQLDVATRFQRRLSQVTGHTPVFYISENDLHDFLRHSPEDRRKAGSLGGVFITEHEQGGREYILINADMAADSRVNRHMVLHEGTHAGSYGNLKSKPHLRKMLRRIMDAAQDKETPGHIVNVKKVYAFTNEYEFLSEAAGNTNIQNRLKDIPASPLLIAQMGGKGRILTLWDAFVEVIRRLIGANPDTRSLLALTLDVGEQATRGKMTVSDVEMMARETAAPDVDSRQEIKEEKGAEGKPQMVIPGAKQRPKEALQRKAEAPLKAKQIQKAMDFGLFSDESKQEDMFASPANPPPKDRPSLEELAAKYDAITADVRKQLDAFEKSPRFEIRMGAKRRLVTKNIDDPKSPYRITFVDENGPWGHETFKNLDEVARELTNDIVGGFRVYTPKAQSEMFAIRDAGQEAIELKLAQRNYPKLGKILGFFGGVGGKQPWTATELRVKVQDIMLRWRRAQEQWARDNPGQTLPPDMDVYRWYNLSFGKKDKRMRDAEKKYLDPIVKEINDRGLTYDEVGDYLYAMHAEERNRDLRAINPAFQTLFGGDPSGMSDADARVILQRASARQADYDAVYKLVRTMINDTLDMQVKDGLITQQMANTWRARWPNYVPLRHTETGEGWMGVGKGSEVRGREYKPAFGREARADNPLSFAFAQMQHAIIRGENNAIGQSVGKFVQANPEPSLWLYNVGPKITFIDTKTGLVTTMTDPQWRKRDDVFTWKENGVEQSVWFVDKDYGAKLARALKHLEKGQMNKFLLLASTLTRNMARLATSWNLEFMVSNFFRDVGEAYLLIPAENRKNLGKRWRRRLFPALWGAWKGQRGGTGRYADAYREFEREGGKIGFLGEHGAEKVEQNIQSAMKAALPGMGGAARRGYKRFFELLDEINGSIENGTRLAMYMAGKDIGLTNAHSASLAREATVNFNRKGEWGSILSAGYMFANAGIQGPVRMMGALKTSSKVRKAAAGLAGLGGLLALWNIWAGGDDEDGTSKYSNMAAWQRSANWVMMKPDGSGEFLFNFPAPLGFALFKNIGDYIVSAIYDPAGHPIGKTISAIFMELVSSFDPLGRDQGMIAHFTPAALKPIPHLIFNEDAFGRPINPNKQFYNKFLPDSHDQFRTASLPAQWIARNVNELTGGTNKIPGYIDFGPGTFDYMTGFVTGGLGRFILNSAQTGTRLINGQEWLPEKTPFVRRFYGEVKDEGQRKKYFDERVETQEAYQQKRVEAPEYMAAKMFTQVDRARRAIAKEMQAVKDDETLSYAEIDEKLKALRKQENELMHGARKYLESIRAGAEGREPRFQQGGQVPTPRKRPAQAPKYDWGRGYKEGEWDPSQWTSGPRRSYANPYTGEYEKFSPKEVIEPAERPMMGWQPEEWPDYYPDPDAVKKEYQRYERDPKSFGLYEQGGLVQQRRSQGGLTYRADGGNVKKKEYYSPFPTEDRDISWFHEKEPTDEKRSEKVFGKDVMDFPDKDMTIFPHHLDIPKEDEI